MYKNYLNEISEFIYKNRYIFIISFFVMIFVYGLSIFTYKYGLDGPGTAMHNINGVAYFNEPLKRYGLYLMDNLFPVLSYHIVSQISGMFGVVLAALLMISKYQYSFNERLIFVLFALISPVLIFGQYFYFTFGYGLICLPLTILAYNLMEYALQNKKYILLILVVLIVGFLISTVAVYAIFFCVIALWNMILNYLDDRNIKYSFKTGITAFLTTILGIFVYLLSIKIISGNWKLYGEMYLPNLSEGVFAGIYQRIILVFEAMFGLGSFNITHNWIFTVMLIISLIMFSLKIRDRNKVLWLVFLYVLFFISIFVSIFMFNKQMRTHISLVFYQSFAVLLFIMSFNKKQIVNVISAIILICMIIVNGSLSAKLYNAHMLQYEQDKVIGTMILNDLYKKFPFIMQGDLYSINFIGAINYPYKHPRLVKIEEVGMSFFSTNYQYKHPRLVKIEEVGMSFFSTFESDRMSNFLYILGLPYNIYHRGMDYGLYEYTKDLPVWPDEKSIGMYGNTIYVKLSNVSEPYVEQLKKGELLNVNQDNYFIYNWSPAEPQFRWSLTNESIIRIPIEQFNNKIKIDMKMFPYLNEKVTSQSIKIIVGKKEFMFDMNREDGLYTFEVDKEDVDNNILIIKTILQNQVSSPSKVGLGDKRMLGYQLFSLQYNTID